MIGFIQIFVLIFALFAFSRAVLRYKGGSLKLAELLFWAAIWILGILFALFPGILNWLSSVGGFIRGMDFVVTSSIIVLFYLMFRLYVKMDELDQTITRLVREIAMSKGKK
jgi:small membrane protein